MYSKVSEVKIVTNLGGMDSGLWGASHAPFVELDASYKKAHGP